MQEIGVPKRGLGYRYKFESQQWINKLLSLRFNKISWVNASKEKKIAKDITQGTFKGQEEKNNT